MLFDKLFSEEKLSICAALPLKNVSDDINSLLKDSFQSYYNQLCEISEITDKTLKSVKKSQESILKAVNYYSVNDFDLSYNTIIEMFESIKSPLVAISNYYSKYTFPMWYRARIIGNEENHTHAKALFHVPFNERVKIKSDRYNSKEFPCLYLGATPYACYVELGCPQKDNLYFAQFEIPETYRFIAPSILPLEFKKWLVNENNMDSEKQEQLMLQYLELVPLIIACSIQVSDKKENNSEKIIEYCIPQFLTKWLIESKTEFDGILYFSTASPTRSNKNYRLYQNLVIPVKSFYQTKGYCDILSKEIIMTKPICARKYDFSQSGYDTKTVPVLARAFAKNGMVLKEPQKIDGKGYIHYSDSAYQKIECVLSGKERRVFSDWNK